MSPLAWGRGSKLLARDKSAPQAGRPSRGGVDRNGCVATAGNLIGRRPSRGGVDRNNSVAEDKVNPTGRPSRGGVDRNRYASVIEHGASRSPLAWGRGSKHLSTDDCVLHALSPLAWGRGSKHNTHCGPGTSRSSPLAWGRGSKLWTPRGKPRDRGVAPRVGAWIETSKAPHSEFTMSGRPSRGGVDRNSASLSNIASIAGVAPRVGAWIETFATSLRNCGDTSPLAWGRGSKL